MDDQIKYDRVLPDNTVRIEIYCSCTHIAADTRVTNLPAKISITPTN